MNKIALWQKRLRLLQAFDDPEGSEGKAADGKGEAEGGSKDGGKATGADEKKYSDADLDKIIGQKFAKWQKDQEKAVSEAKRLAAMTEQEKAEHERDEIKKELEALKRANNMAEMGKQARKMLSDDGITIPDDLVDMVIAEDADKTKTRVQTFSRLFKAAVQDAVKDTLKGRAPGTSTSPGTPTKEQIMAIKDRTERQQMIRKYRDLF